MGITFILIGLVFEVGFLVFCIVTKDYHKRIRGFIRLGSFLIFLVLLVFTIIRWGFQWYLLMAYLVVLFLISVVQLIHNSEKEKVYKTSRVIWKAIGMQLLLSVVLLPVLIFPQYKLPDITGNYEVATKTFTYTDEGRIEEHSEEGEKRKVIVQFWYPMGIEDSASLIIFDHGAFGIRSSNTSTYTELASNGYVVCAVDHPFQSFYTEDEEGNSYFVDKSFIQEVVDANNGVYTDKETYNLEKKWLETRVDDLEFVLNTIEKKVSDATSDSMYHYIDMNKVGVMGHSLGGAAAVEMGRIRSDVDAVINLDGDMLGEYIDFDGNTIVMNQKPYPIPILTIYSDDMIKARENAKKRGYTDPQDHITRLSKDANVIEIAGTNHMSLTDLPLFSPFLTRMICNSVDIGKGKEKDKLEIINQMNREVLSFFNRNLKS